MFQKVQVTYIIQQQELEQQLVQLVHFLITQEQVLLVIHRVIQTVLVKVQLTFTIQLQELEQQLVQVVTFHTTAQLV